jgi:hypothetical protein
LNLTEDANEDSILKGIEDMKAQIVELQNAIKSKEDEIAKINKEKADAKIEADSLALVENAIKEGRIKDVAKASFLNLAKIDFEGTKAAIEAMPVTAVANKVPLADLKDEKTKDWTYSDWEKKDPQGLINMYNSNREMYDSLLNDFKTKKTK